MEFKKRFLFLSLFVIYTTTFSESTYAAHNTQEDSLRLYEAIAAKPLSIQEHTLPTAETKNIVLPVSRNFNQKLTGLCWSYAFFNALETLHLVESPEDKFELSRGAMQYINMKDRIQLQIQGLDNHLDLNGSANWSVEGGTVTDAVYLLKTHGAYQFSDYHDIQSNSNYSKLWQAVFTASTTDERLAKTEEELIKHFQAPLPEKTFFNDEWLSPVEFGSSLVITGEWNSYAISKNDSEYLATDPDPDARSGSMTYFMSREKVLEKITSALKRNRPIVYSNIAHLVLIYGAEFDSKENPINFYIKNSNGFPQFFYKADAKRTLDNLGEISVLE